jgi:hypothetical protein
MIGLQRGDDKARHPRARAGGVCHPSARPPPRDPPGCTAPLAYAARSSSGEENTELPPLASERSTVKVPNQGNTMWHTYSMQGLPSTTFFGGGGSV